ncbi:MAG: S8 family serine peptidase [Saprospiraceae bacterium]|nr:S8 family serine peptidase [Saprospiraceae bacterium]
MEHASRYILKLKEVKSSDLNKIEKELQTRITSSAELSSKVRAQNIYESGNSLYLKNLGIVILDNIDGKQMESLKNKRNSPISHYEQSRNIFRPVSELDLLEDLKRKAIQFTEQISAIEALIKSKSNDRPNHRFTWGLNSINLSTSQYDGSGVSVCILDTGFYVEHPDFEGRNISGKSFVPNQGWEDDINGHGTHCVGSACGFTSSENGIRYGVAPGTDIAIGKVLDNEGNGTNDWIYDALDNCIQKKYKVVSMSFGAPVNLAEQPSPIFEHIGNIALENNCLLIAAAGNDSDRPNLPRPVSSPANCESFMAVAALNRNLKVSSFSNAGINANSGGRVDISAPGVEVYSSYSPNALGNKYYATLNGTSMAAPHVAGLAALYCQAFPNNSASDIWMKLEKKAKQLNNQLIRDVGNGIIQAI